MQVRNALEGFDIDLIARYNVSGPRYTSYPTAKEFVEDFSAGQYIRALERIPSNAPLSLYLHVPFSATICYYCACNKIITNNRKHAVGYLEKLLQEIAMIPRWLKPGQRVEQLHFGGGTPTYFSEEQFEAVFAALNRNYDLAADDQRDFSVEIDPRTVDAARIAHLANLGINRVSLGVQDFDPAVQKAVNRIQSVAETVAVVDAARAEGMRSASLDLIYGLPLQSRQSFNETLNKIIDIAPDRLSIYNYAHLPQMFKTQKQINVVDLPASQEKLGILADTIARLTQAGYVYVGMDHFAKVSDPLAVALEDGTLRRNFQGYTTHGYCDLIGFGVSAISQVNGVYSQNAKTLEGYQRALEQGRLPVERGVVLSTDDLITREVIETLMTRFRLSMDTFSKRHHIDFRSYFAAELERLKECVEDDLVVMGDDTIEVTARGRFLIRNICMCFDAYLNTQAQAFSKAI
ncbi:MAG: oxygen-independent coproporphyrinogen III oxidase [Proteobacteria bacterium]|nr:oxygen-independent coproporphyrinogen III oxidase [Pseudomonadota bacterium]